MHPTALGLVVLLVTFSAADAAAQVVTRVIDGDTLIVDGVGTVRLIGVDTPESVDPRRPVERFAKEASEFTREMAAGQVARLEFDTERRDRYGRTLAYVYLPGGVFLNAEIVRQGYGHAYTRFPFRFLDDFRAYEREAREAGRGLWADGLNAPVAKAGGQAAQASCVDLNSADTEALIRIVHVGPERAGQIVELRMRRAFRSVAELTRVNGIGPARMKDIFAQGLACVR